MNNQIQAKPNYCREKNEQQNMAARNTAFPGTNSANVQSMTFITNHTQRHLAHCSEAFEPLKSSSSHGAQQNSGSFTSEVACNN